MIGVRFRDWNALYGEFPLSPDAVGRTDSIGG